MGSVTLHAPAKLTTRLHLTGVRADGMHEIDAEMVTVDLADELTVWDDEPPALEVVPAGTGLSVTLGSDNSVTRALALVERRARVRLVKRIPAGAGLGGGSADAAAILRWAGWDDALGAAVLGADVPFCIRGGRARVTGIGEILEPLPFVRATYTLAIPPFGCSTPAVYRAWDALGGPQPDARNHLEAAAIHVEPRLADWRDRLADETGVEPVLAGSGSTWFVPGAFPGTGRTVVQTCAPEPDPVPPR